MCTRWGMDLFKGSVWLEMCTTIGLGCRGAILVGSVYKIRPRDFPGPMNHF